MADRPTVEGTDTSSKTRVFLSYSRADREFTQRLASALTMRGYVADFDQADFDPTNVETGISAEDDWWQRLQEMIASAEAIVFIVSPASARSKVCDEEIAYARALGKRVIPILFQSVDFAAVPPRLAALNIKLSFANAADFESSVAALAAALDFDVAWHREGARLMSLAVKWERDGRPEWQLLAAGAVANAEIWAGHRPANAPLPGELLRAYLTESEKKAKVDLERLLTITGRAFVRPAEQAIAQGHYDHALRLVAAGTILGEDLSMSLVPERVDSAFLAARATQLYAALHGHEAWIHSAVFSSDGARIVTASKDKTARVWDAATGRELIVLRGHEGEVSSAAFSADGTRIATASADKTARVWDATSGRELIVMGGHKYNPAKIAFSPDGARVVTTSLAIADNTARVWDAASGRELFTLPGHSAAFSPDGGRIVTASKDKTARVWDAASGKELVNLHGFEGAISSAAFSPDGTRIVISGDRWDPGSNAVQVWDASSGRELTVLRVHEERLHGASFSPDGTQIVTASNSSKTLRVWDANDGTELVTLRGYEAGDQIAFSPDGTRIVSADHCTALVWDATGGREHANLRGHEGEVSSATFSPNGTRIVTASKDKTARVWDVTSGRELIVLRAHEDELHSAVFSSDGARIVTASKDKTARVWDVTSGRELIVLRGHKGEVLSAAFSVDASRIVTASKDKTARIWDATSGRELIVLREHEDELHSAVFSPDGTQIVTASKDKTARVWDVTSGRELIVLRGHEGGCGEVTALSESDIAAIREGLAWARASFSPDGTRIVTTLSGDVPRVWEATSGRELAPLLGIEDGFQEMPMWVTAFSSDGTRIAGSTFLGINGSQVRVWDAVSGEQLVTLRWHDGGVSNAAFSPDGRRIVTASNDKTARLWDATTGRELAVLRGHESRVSSAMFSSDGMQVITASGNTVRVWDVRRTEGLLGECAEVLAASLTRGRGLRTDPEREDLLMQSVANSDDDLCAALTSRMEQKNPGAAQRVAVLSDLLAPSARPRAAAEHAFPAKEKAPLAASELKQSQPRESSSTSSAGSQLRLSNAVVTGLIWGGISAGILFALFQSGFLHFN